MVDACAELGELSMSSDVTDGNGGANESQRDIVELQAMLHASADKLLAYLKRQMPKDLRRFVDAQDILQDTFFEAFQRSAEFRVQGEDSAYRWLVTIARHRMVAVLRMQQALKRGGRRPNNDPLNSVVGFLEELAVYTRTPSQSAMSHELAKAVQDSMNCLNDSYREVLKFRFVEGLSVKQTAHRMGRTDGAVLMLCNRGLKALKARMELASLPN
jgi:RNA polymerase sigma-70 factor, ECF subfamily